MAKTIKVDILADASGYQRGLKTAEAETRGFGARTSSIFASFAKGVAVAGVAVGALAVEIGKKSVEAAVQAQEANDRLTASFKAQKIAMDASSGAVLQTEAAGRKFGFTNNESRDALTKLIQAGKGWTGSVKELAVAQDLARARGMSLADATGGLIKLQAGATRAAKQFGIVLPPVTAAVDKLKASKVDLTTAAGKEELAHARIQDKLATGQAYYDAVTQKVKGQGDAFAKSAAGGMAQFHAQLQNVEERIGGALLPQLGKVLGWVNTKWPEINAGLTQGAQAISTGFGAVADQVRQKWAEFGPQITETAKTSFASLVEASRGVVDIIKTLWQDFGGPIKAVFKATFDYIIASIRAAMQIIRGVVNIIGGLLHGDWSRVWTGIKQVGQGIWDAIVALFKYRWEMLKAIAQAVMTALKGIMSAAWDEIKSLASSAWASVVATIEGYLGRAKAAATAIGQGILHGIDSGLTGLVKMVQGWFQSLWAWIKGAAKSAAAFAFAVGAAIPKGIWDGIQSAAGWLWGKLGGFVDRMKNRLEFWHSPPSEYGKWLGSELVKGIVAALNQGASTAGKAAGDLVGTIKGSAVKGMGNATAAIVAAAKKTGVDARAALAVAMTEGGTSFGAVGDKGTSFGPFQMHLGGALGNMDPGKAAAFANSIRGIDAALRMMAEGGAKGKIGFDAITAIVRNFERPADPSGEIKKAIGFYKQIPGAIGGGLTDGAKAAAALVKSTLAGMVSLVKEFGPKIGIEHARGIIAGLVQTTPSLVDQARQQMQQAAAAARQAVVDSRAAFVSAFSSLAQQALSAFDAQVANWQSPASRMLAKMQAEDQAKQVKDAVTSAQSAWNQAAQDANTAYQNFIGATQGAGESDADFAARQADLKKQWDEKLAAFKTAQDGLDAAKRAQIEYNLGLEDAQQTAHHNQVMATMRERLAEQLALLRTELAKHPEEWDKTYAKVKKVLDKYHIPLYTAGQQWAEKFTGGLVDGLSGLQKALADFLKSASVGGGAGGGAGGPGRPPDVGGGLGAPLQVHTSIQLDGREIARSVTDHQIRYGMSNVSTGLA